MIWYILGIISTFVFIFAARWFIDKWECRRFNWDEAGEESFGLPALNIPRQNPNLSSRQNGLRLLWRLHNITENWDETPAQRSRNLKRTLKTNTRLPLSPGMKGRHNAVQNY